MEEFVWAVVLYDCRGNFTQQYGIVRALSSDQAAMWGLSTAKSRRPDMPHIGAFGAMHLRELQERPGIAIGEDK